MIEDILDGATLEWLNRVMSNSKDHSKLTTKRLEEISAKIFPEDVHKYNFPNMDTCHCSSSQRRGYRERFERSLNIMITGK